MNANNFIVIGNGYDLCLGFGTTFSNFYLDQSDKEYI